MSNITLFKSYAEPPFDIKEILRYSGCKSADKETEELLNTCMDEVRKVLTYKACYRDFSVCIKGNLCDFKDFSVQSKNLAEFLKGRENVTVFAATVGVGIDRLIAKYSRISPSKALMLQAIGAERIEALCNAFCNDLSACNNSCIRRFSPGYGDLPLEVQRDIFSVLDCGKYIGVSLNGSLVMSPSKSVTAFAVASDAINKDDKCRLCGKKDCEYRGAL